MKAKTLTKLGETTLQNLIDFINESEDSLKADIKEYGIGIIVDEYIYSLEALAAYWLHSYGNESIEILAIHEAESDSEYIFETMNLKFTFEELRCFLKECIK